MLPIKYKNGSFPTNGVLALEDLADLTNTVLDPKIEEHGDMIRLPCTCLDWQNRETTEVWLPPFAAIREGEVVVLNPIQGSAQSLLVAVEKFKTKEYEDKQLARALIAYQISAIKQLFGKNGMISKFIMTSRMKKSGRAVLLPRSGGDPCTCEIPSWMMDGLKLKDGDLVVVGRDPTIWEGGIEVLRAIGCKSNVIRLHPLLFKQLNADCDGDAVWVLAIPFYLKKEAQAHLGSFMKRVAEWPTPYAFYGKPVNWDTVEHEMDDRSAPTGFSVGPEDILGDSDILDRVEAITCKELKESCIAAANGLSAEEWKTIVLETNENQLKMKVGMGPVGAAAMAVRILAYDDPRARRSASLISERIEQKLLDSKKAKDIGDEFSHETALDILHMRNEWVDVEVDEAVDAMSKCLGLKKSDVRPIVSNIWSNNKGLSAIIRDKFPLFASTTQISENTDQAKILAEEIIIHKRIEQNGLAKFTLDALLEHEEILDAVEA